MTRNAKGRRAHIIKNPTAEIVAQNLLTVMQLENEMDAIYNQLKKFRRSIGLAPNEWGKSFYNLDKAMELVFPDDPQEIHKVYAAALIHDKELAFQYFDHNWRNHGSYFTTERSNAFATIIEYPDEIFSRLYRPTLTEQCSPLGYWELDELYQKHGKYLYEKTYKSLDSFFKYCRMFGQFITYDNMELLVKRIIGRKKIDMAEFLLKEIDISLPPNLRDKIDNLVMTNELSNGALRKRR